MSFEIPEQQLSRIEEDAFLFKVPDELRGKFDRVEFVMSNFVGPPRLDGGLRRSIVSPRQSGSPPSRQSEAQTHFDQPRNRFADGEPFTARRSESNQTLTDSSTGPIALQQSQFMGPQLSRDQQDQNAQAFKEYLQTMSNLNVVSSAILNYESANGKMPTIGSRDSDGKLLLSWRVHLLPFLEQDELYQRFRLDEPWNSPHNLELLSFIPKVYAGLDSGEKALTWKTRIQLPVGEGFFLDPKIREQGRSEDLEISAFTDGTSNTVGVIRVAKSAAVPWTQPADWNGDAKKLIGDGGFWKKRVCYARVDGQVGTLETPISANFLKAILTRDGGERIDWKNKSVPADQQVCGSNARASA